LVAPAKRSKLRANLYHGESHLARERKRK
jgi:hypothetical protein